LILFNLKFDMQKLVQNLL